MSEEIRLPEAFGPPPKPSIDPERRKDYEVRLNHQQVVTLLPATMWRTAERLGKLPPQESATVLDTSAIDAQLLKLYYLAQQYTLIPNTDATLQKETELETLAIDCPALDDDALLAKAKLLRTQQDLPPSPDALTTSEHWSTLADDLEPGFAHATELLARQQWLRRLKLRKAILTTLAQPQVRARYQAELQEVRGVQKRPQTRKRLNDLIDTQADRGWAAQTIRSTLVDHYIKQKPLTGVTRDAVKQLGRMVDAAETKEQGIVGAMSLEQRGLLKTTQLLEYKRQLDEHGFVLTKSREALVTEIARLAARGYRIFLGGPTGAGKTNLALFALKEQTDGSFSWITWTGETSVRDLFGSPTLTATADGRIESGMSHGPMTQAVLGVKDGILHEEFTGGQNNVQMSLKTLWASQPGDTVNLPGFNGTQFTKEHLVEIATGNLKGRRHQDREAMDPAVAREFKSLEVTFLPANEQRDIILAMLIDKTGILPLSKVEIELIDQLCKSAELSQRAYLEEIPSDIRNSDYYKVVSPTGDPVTLTKVFLDTGTLMDLFRGWQPSGESLSVFLGRGLDNFVNTSVHFTELKQEQATMRNILAAYGFRLEGSTLAFSPTMPSTRDRLRPYQRPIDLGDLVEDAPPSTIDPYAKPDAPNPDATKPEAPKGIRQEPLTYSSASLSESDSDLLVAAIGRTQQIVRITEPKIEDPQRLERTPELLEALRQFYMTRDSEMIVNPFKEGRAAVRKGKGEWFIKEDGTELSAERYDTVSDFCQGRAAVQIGDKKWHIKLDGSSLDENEYDEITDFKDGKATVTQGSLSWVIDIDGEQIPEREITLGSESNVIVRQLQATYGDSNVGTIQEGRVWTRSAIGEVRYYFGINGVNLNDTVYEDGLPFSEGRASVKLNGKWYFIKRDGTPLTTPVYRVAKPFENGVARVTEFMAANGKPGETYFIDIDGNRIEQLPLPPEFEAQQRMKAASRQALTAPPSLPGSSTMRTVGSDELQGLPMVNQIQNQNSNENSRATPTPRELDGLAKKWKREGLIDSMDISSFAEGRVVVRKGNKKNLFALDGTPILIGWYSIVEPFQEGFALIGEPKSMYFVRPNGTKLNVVPFYEAERFNNGWARVRIGVTEPWMFMDKLGNIVVEPPF